MPPTYDGYVVTFEGKMLHDTFGMTPEQAKWRLLINSRPARRISELSDEDMHEFWRKWWEQGFRIVRARLEVLEVADA